MAADGELRVEVANALASLLVRLSRRFAVRGEGQLTYADYALLRKFRVRFPPAGQSGAPSG